MRRMTRWGITLAAALGAFGCAGVRAQAGSAGTPGGIVKKLNGELVRILKSKETNDYLLNTGVEIDPGTPEQLAQTVKAEEEKYRKIIRAAGIKPE